MGGEMGFPSVEQERSVGVWSVAGNGERDLGGGDSKDDAHDGVAR
jgi:hypothetical protein